MCKSLKYIVQQHEMKRGINIAILQYLIYSIFKMAKLIVEIPDHLHLQLKSYAVINHCTLRQVVLNLLENHLFKPKTATHSTGFCGAWVDKRSSEKIIQELHEARNLFKYRLK